MVCHSNAFFKINFDITDTVAGQLGPWTTRRVDSSARSGQLGAWTARPVADNSARRYNYTECLSRDSKMINYLLEVILSCLWSKSIII